MFILAGGSGASVSGQTTTFSKDIAPIVFDRCASCHHDGGSAPFSLLNFESARQRATQIARVTRAGFMPPWKADTSEGAFVGQQRLTAAELDVIQRWVDGGAAEGDPRDLPPAPRIVRGWQLGEPDLIVSTPAYTLPAAGTDVFRIFVIPLPVDRARFVRGLEFRPGNPRVVHHANIRVDRTPASRAFDAEDPAPGYDGLIAHSAVYPDGHFLGWTPGQVAPLLPKGLAWTLERGTDLVVELHMQPTGKPEDVQPSIGLYYGADPPERTPAMLRLGRQSIDIPAGQKRYTITDSFVVPVDVEVQAVQPHAHYRAREVTGTATLPDGTIKQLIQIRDWDFRWQHVYRYASPFTLPKGTTLAMSFTYDNSAENPRNPRQPPARVFWGQRSADEMGDLWIQVLTRDRQALDLLMGAFRPKVLAEDVIGYERVLQSEPTSAALHDDVASLYLQLGRGEDAVSHFMRSAQLRPGVAASHFNLGTALTVAGRFDDAIAQFRRALELKPDYAQAHNNLASIYSRQGNTTRALAHLRDAIRLDPRHVEAHVNLADVYAAAGDREGALAALRAALQLGPSERLTTYIQGRIAELAATPRP